MPRLISIGVVFLMVLLAAQPAPAADKDGRQLERMTRKLEKMFRPNGAMRLEAEKLTFKNLGGGFYLLSYPLAAAKLAEGIALQRDDEEEEEKAIRTLAIGHMASEPINPGAMVNSVVSDTETLYNVWLTVLNRGDEELERRTAVRITGPEEFEVFAADEVPYQSRSVNLIWFNPEVPFEATGLYTYRINVRTGGKQFYRFWVEPLVSDAE